MAKERFYRVAIEGDWEIDTKGPDGKTKKVRVRKGQIFGCHGSKDYSQTRSFDLVPYDADGIKILKRWGRLERTLDRFERLAKSDYAEAKSVVADLSAGTKYAPKSQKKDDLVAFVAALVEMEPLPSAKSE